MQPNDQSPLLDACTQTRGSIRVQLAHFVPPVLDRFEGAGVCSIRRCNVTAVSTNLVAGPTGTKDERPDICEVCYEGTTEAFPLRSYTDIYKAAKTDKDFRLELYKAVMIKLGRVKRGFNPEMCDSVVEVGYVMKKTMQFYSDAAFKAAS